VREIAVIAASDAEFTDEEKANSQNKHPRFRLHEKSRGSEKMNDEEEQGSG
jgi:hypothetical protein